MVIREANQADAPSWCEMRAMLWPDSANIHKKEIAAYFDGRAIDIEQVFVVEQANLRLAGFIELNIRNFAEGSRSSKVPYVEGWFVLPQFRGKQWGIKLMQHAERWAKNLGYQELASDTEIDNERSRLLHAQLGFQEIDQIVCFLKKF